ncbi:S1 family peptidase [Sphingomonas sp. IC-56]|uniref:S1 family peptidase n=1 Tax=Sphingomonas sp. IC-56 TaxID=2898529 RepID=UPI001E29919E|nr:S1 family peptidase [Sphingomonas sp. IC-56]MCD2324791.1 S1 family peptidase [Sphingomonas sp. IC-56]
MLKRVAAALSAIMVLAAAPAAAQVQTREQALAQDAGEYARLYGVPQDEALRRLHAQADSIPVTDAIANQYRDRLAGISIQHRPDYRINVYLAGSEPVAERRIRAGGMSVPITFRTGAKASRERVVWAITYHQGAIRAALPSPPSMGLDPRTGELVVIAGGAVTARQGGAAALDAKLSALAGVPVQVRVMDRVDVNLGLHGGSRVDGIDPANGKRYRCTTGFAVTDGSRTGITTAAHCLDDMTYYAPDRSTMPLSFVGQWGWGYHDVQIFAGPAPERPLIYSDTARKVERPVEAQVTRPSTRAGDFVCHRGESSGYSCAEVELLDFAPAGDLCGGACLPTWVAVKGPTCKGGDSGGPVFSGTSAYGVVKGASYQTDGSCAFYFYMSLDYLPAGWKLLTDPLLVPLRGNLPQTLQR